MAPADKKAKRPESEWFLLLHRILCATEGKDLSDPQVLLELPFPSLEIAPPERFVLQGQGADRTFKYMGRTGYANFRNVVLGLYPGPRDPALGTLPVRVEHANASSIYAKAALWGTMGSGKSYMLAALACDLIASFHRSSKGKQRAVYIPDCGDLLVEDLRVEVFRNALKLSYADENDALRRIAAISNQESSLKAFLQAERQRNVCIYLILDQFNALEPSKDDSAPGVQMKGSAHNLIYALAYQQLLITSASANNMNSKKWYSKQLNVTPVFHHGGLDNAEYQSWKKHFSSVGGLKTSLNQLEGDDELRVEDSTGRVPLFLKQWSDYTDTPEKAWQRFINMKEVSAADSQLRLFIHEQLAPQSGAVRPDFVINPLLDMYLQFMTGGRVQADPSEYDCRYLYRKDGFGRCVCGMYRDFIAQILQTAQHCKLAACRWTDAIFRETRKEHPNSSLLGFLIEQNMIAEILMNGIPLYGNKVMKCSEVVYFSSGEEKLLPIKEGCILYVPDAFNYKRVDCVVRQLVTSTKLKDARPPTTVQDMLETYCESPVLVAGVQITLGDLAKHSSSEAHFCSPSVMEVWYPGWDKKDVGRFFIWYTLQSELDKHTSDAIMLSPCMYASREVRGRTRGGPVRQLDHITIFYALEDYEPCLKNLRK